MVCTSEGEICSLVLLAVSVACRQPYLEVLGLCFFPCSNLNAVIMFPYSSLVVYAVVSVATSFLVTTFRISIWILDGLHTYIHPENVGNGDQGNARAVIRRPAVERDSNSGETDSQDASFTQAPGNGTDADNSASVGESEGGSMESGENPQQERRSLKEGDGHLKGRRKLKERLKPNPLRVSRKKKDKLREKIEFDETDAQILRLRLCDSQLESRQYFSEYDEAIIYASLGFSNLIVHQFLPACASSGNKEAVSAFFRGDLIPLIVGLFAIYKLVCLLGRISLDRSSSKNSEQLLSVFVGCLGFLVAFTILSVLAPDVVDLRIGVTSSAESNKNEGTQMGFQFGFMKLLLAIFAGWLSGILFSPAHKSVRSFWLGTDQLHWNLSVIGAGKVTRTLFYLNMVVPIFTSLLWIKPMANIFVLQSARHQSFNSLKPSEFPSDASDQRGLQEAAICSDSLSGQNIGLDCTAVPKDCLRQNKITVCSNRKEDLDLSGSPLSQGEHTFDQRQKNDMSPSRRSQDFSLDSSNANMLYGGDSKWFFWRGFYSSYQEDWAHEVGMPRGAFEQFRRWCLLFTGILQLLLMRPNLQMYLNEAVLTWYQRLHGSRIPNLDSSRAKLFLHNYFLCQAALQFLIPETLALLFLGLSQTRRIVIGGLFLPENFPFSPSFVQEAAFFMAWWVQFVWAVLTCSNLALYRLGFLMIT